MADTSSTPRPPSSTASAARPGTTASAARPATTASAARPAPVPEIAPADVKGWTGRARLIDVRESYEFKGELGHVAGAELVPLGTLDEAMKDWPKFSNLIVICRSGARSRQAAEKLLAAGFKTVMNLTGGMKAWNDAGLPVER
jgi:rhodanese-related sulfurtransferase